MTLDHLKHPPPNSPGWLVQVTLPCRPGSNKGASWTTMAQDPGLYVPMSKVTPKMTRSSQSKITTTSNNLYTKMLLLVVGDIGYPEVVKPPFCLLTIIYIFTQFLKVRVR